MGAGCLLPGAAQGHSATRWETGQNPPIQGLPVCQHIQICFLAGKMHRQQHFSPSTAAVSIYCSAASSAAASAGEPRGVQHPDPSQGWQCCTCWAGDSCLFPVLLALLSAASWQAAHTASQQGSLTLSACPAHVPGPLTERNRQGLVRRLSSVNESTHCNTV